MDSKDAPINQYVISQHLWVIIEAECIKIQADQYLACFITMKTLRS